jgi:UDP-N-acetylmuramoyl-L-alanyl-D-glutamate--2,6-diaminopimelate ligase
MTLAELATRVGGETFGDAATTVSDVTHDSRLAGPADLFVALRGAHVDGHDFVTGTVAAAVCVDHPIPTPGPGLVVADTRAALGPLAAAVHGDPSTALTVAGITGTNGKTTVTQMLASIGRAAGHTCGVVGTVGAFIGDESFELARTSPEASDFQRLLARMVEAGVGLAAVEVSSHALEYGRVAATRFAVVAFTNLSQDHLDFHGDMESYYRAKARLFDSEAPAVVAVTDAYGRRLAEEVAPALTVGPGGDVRSEILEARLTNTRFKLTTPVDTIELNLPMGGDFNVTNALVAAGCATVLELPLPAIKTGLEATPLIPGRFEPIPTGREFSVLVDYAHTPDSIKRAIAAARTAARRVIVVVGAAGDRDARKRAPMGAAAAAADLAIITSDNPRSEDPDALVAAVISGVGDGGAVAEVDRRKAIRLAFEKAGPGDVVLILGKGHEHGQEIAGVVRPFADREVALEELAAL